MRYFQRKVLLHASCLPSAAIGAGSVLRALLTASFLFLVGSCGNTTYYNGTPVVVMTGTNSHFTSFIVSIDSITLTRDDGNIFNGLSLAEQVDLSRVVDLSQLLEAPAIPTGNYKQGTITLDFSAPLISYDSNGQSVGLTATDNTGPPLTTVTLTFNFDPNHPLVINYQQGVNLGLEFDLARLDDRECLRRHHDLHPDGGRQHAARQQQPGSRPRTVPHHAARKQHSSS